MKSWAFLFLVAVTAFGQKLTINSIPNPSPSGSLQPNWSVAPDGAAVLSWIEPVKNSKTEAYALRYAVRHGDTWSEARTIASGRHFFRPPAEAPGVQQLGDKLWMAHWIEMPDEES